MLPDVRIRTSLIALIAGSRMCLAVVVSHTATMRYSSSIISLSPVSCPRLRSRQRPSCDTHSIHKPAGIRRLGAGLEAPALRPTPQLDKTDRGHGESLLQVRIVGTDLYDC